VNVVKRTRRYRQAAARSNHRWTKGLNVSCSLVASHVPPSPIEIREPKQLQSCFTSQPSSAAVAIPNVGRYCSNGTGLSVQVDSRPQPSPEQHRGRECIQRSRMSGGDHDREELETIPEGGWESDNFAEYDVRVPAIPFHDDFLSMSREEGRGSALELELLPKPTRRQGLPTTYDCCVIL
jgi:hypothetical protein